MRIVYGAAIVALMAAQGISAAQASVQTPALQQDSAKSVAANPALGGPLVPGVCLLSPDAILRNAKVAKAADVRLQQLARAAQAEINAERQPLQAQAKALQAEAAKLKPEDRAAREKALIAKLQPIQAKEQLRSREIAATRAKVIERISNEAQPVIAAAYQARRCGLLVNRNSVLGGNMGNDITQTVLQGLDARITTINFERETLPATATPAAR